MDRYAYESLGGALLTREEWGAIMTEMKDKQKGTGTWCKKDDVPQVIFKDRNRDHRDTSPVPGIGSGSNGPEAGGVIS